MAQKQAAAAAESPKKAARRSTADLIPFTQGMDCYADDREALNDFEKYFNNSYLSDVSLLVADDSFPAHRLVLAKCSEVFERMLSEKWQGTSKEIELVEEPLCVPVFAAFLRFLYTNHVVLNADNTLPILMLADKYNVPSLRRVCLEYATTNLLPDCSLKELFHVWFQYGTKSFHQPLINTCTQVFASCFEEIISNQDWEKEWLSLDRDQLCEFLRSSELSVPNEFELWTAVQRWLQAPGHPERRGNTAAPLLTATLPLIRFPYMTADELMQVERSTLAEQHPKVFQPLLMLAYKYQALSLTSRANSRDFGSTQFLLRNYTDLRWDRRLSIGAVAAIPKFTEVTLKLSTRASAVPAQTWDWELKVHPRGFSASSDEFRCLLSSNVMLDQTRAVEYLFSIVDERKVIRSVAGKKTFTKTRYMVDLETEKRVGLDEILADNSPLLTAGALCMQLTLRPID